MLNDQFCLAGFLTVSYTHLDVYKRQEKNFSLEPGRNTVLDGVGNTTLIDSSYNGPVSYTHLDVYKRQVIHQSTLYRIYRLSMRILLEKLFF